MVFCYRNFMKLIPSLTSSVSHTMIPDSDHIPFKTTSNSIHCPQRQLSCSCHEMQCTLVGVHTRAHVCVWVCVPSCFSRVWLFAAPWTVAHQATLSMGFSRQKYYSGLPHPPSGDLPDPGIEPTSLTSLALAGGFFTTSTTWEAPKSNIAFCYIQVLKVETYIYTYMYIYNSFVLKSKTHILVII